MSFEHRCYARLCPCGHWTEPRRQRSGKSAGFGPRLQAVVASLSGGCRMSKAQVRDALESMFGVQMSPAGIRCCEKPASEASLRCWSKLQQLWILSSAELSVLRIAPMRNAATAPGDVG